MPPKGEQTRQRLADARRPANPQMAAMQRILTMIANRTGITAPRIAGMAPMSVQEGRDPRSAYRPGMATNQTDRKVFIDQGAPGMSRVADPAMNARARQDLLFGLAHESGHIAEPDLVRNRVGADKYTDTTIGTKGRAPYWLTGPQARGEMRSQGIDEFLRRDRWGLPTVGPSGETHSSPNEQYATDFAATQGHGFGSSMRPSPVDRLRSLMRQGILPPGRGNWDERGRDAGRMSPRELAFQRLAALGIDHTTMSSLGGSGSGRTPGSSSGGGGGMVRRR